MIKSKLRKSMIVLKQDTSEISQYLAYFPLISIVDNKLSLNTQGCHILQQQCSGKVFIVAVYSHKKAFINSIYRNNNVLPEHKAGSGVWITNYPRYSLANQNKCLYLHVAFANHEDCIKIHTICSLICSAILIDTADIQTLSFLTAIKSRIIHDKHQNNEKENVNNRKQQVSSLVFLKRSKNKENITDLRRNSREISQILTEFKVEPQIGQLYNQITLLKLSNDCFQDNAYLSGVQQQIRSIAFTNQKNEDLRSGPILKEYLEIVIDSLQKIGMVDILSSVDKIKISQGYSAYMDAVQYYHQNIKRHLKSQDIPNIKEVLRTQREETIEQFKKHSNDAAYLIRINEYMDQKQAKLIEQNNKTHDLKNLAFLQDHSGQLMTKIAREKLTHQQIKPHVENIIKDYQSKASGDNKYEILTNYLNIIYNNAAKEQKQTTQNEVKSVQKELEKTKREKEELQQMVLQVRRENNSKKCCEIM